MVVPIAFCSSAPLDEDSMTEMACCNMKNRRVERAKDVDRLGGRRVNEEEQRSVVVHFPPQTRIPKWETALFWKCAISSNGILIGRRNSNHPWQAWLATGLHICRKNKHRWHHGEFPWLNNKRNSTLAAPLRSRSSRIVTIVKELKFNVSIDIGLEEGEKSRMSSHSAWIRASPGRSHCESTQARRDLRGRNIINYATVTLHSHLRHFQPKATRVQGSSMFQFRGKTANKGNWPSAWETHTAGVP